MNTETPVTIEDRAVIAAETLAQVAQDALAKQAERVDEIAWELEVPASNLGAYPYGVPLNWHKTEVGETMIYQTSPDMIPVWAVARVIHELRNDCERLADELTSCYANLGVAESQRATGEQETDIFMLATRLGLEKVIETLTGHVHNIKARLEQ